MCGKDGLPLSWRHFRYGLDHLRRHHARSNLRMATAVKIGMGPDDPSRKSWDREQRKAAGWD